MFLEPDHFGVVPVATSSQQQQRGGGGGPPLGGGPLLQPPRGSGNSLDPSRSSSLMSDSNSSTQTPDAHPFYKVNPRVLNHVSFNSILKPTCFFRNLRVVTWYFIRTEPKTRTIWRWNGVKL